ncbi:MAG: S41 family peptidase [Candidatus Kapabacteria bacterium]|nr:S41 family peptidase [Candidatus Kapabacteria bacterium]
MKRLTYITLIFIVSSILLEARLNDDYYLKLNKSFEIFGEVYRKLSENYVMELDPELLMEDGIQGMLYGLDPYTSFYSESETDDIDIITDGSYVGIGITISFMDSMLTVTGIRDGYSAQKAGLRIGDRIYMADTAIVLNKTSDEFRKYTKGKPGTYLDLRVLRDGLKDTLRFRIERQEIKVKNVTIATILSDSIGYIKVDRFSRFTDQEIRTALYELKQNKNLKSLILDLRDNPGGLLEAAISTCEIFIPQNNVIVSTKGRNESEIRTYRTIIQPVDTTIPMAVLINEGSASASEIVAGAIQDLDRGIIIGQKSFGKGLVQSVFNMPYNSALKITTSKYYIPSGRCIQKLNFQKGKNKGLNLHYDSVYYTRNGRPVLESNGIIPDSIIKQNEQNLFIADLIAKNIVFKFANFYSSSYDKSPEINKDKLLKSFREYLNSINYTYQSELDARLDSLFLIASKENINKKLQKDLRDLTLKIKKDRKDIISENSEELTKILIKELRSRFVSEEQISKEQLNDDLIIKTAINLLDKKNYNKILNIKNNQ